VSYLLVSDALLLESGVSYLLVSDALLLESGVSYLLVSDALLTPSNAAKKSLLKYSNTDTSAAI